MKRILKNNSGSSIKDIMNHITIEMYTKQTLVSLFRCLLETVIESRFASTVLIKLKNTQNFQGLLNRLKYSELNVYSYSNHDELAGFNQIKLNNPELDHDEFLIIIDDRFSASLYWDETTAEVFGLCDGFCSLNPYDSRQMIDYLQTVSFDEGLDTIIDNIKQDRRRNENFTTILRKLVAGLETRQRDLICANTELKELYDKTLQTEKLAAVGQLCSTIAHELRNPLASIDLYAKIISKNIEKINEGISDPQITESLDNAASCISNATTSLERLLTELIDYSKPMAINSVEDNLEKTLGEVVELIKPNYERKDVTLTFNYHVNEDIRVKFDKVKLNQAVLNIVKNALEVSKAGDVVKVSVEPSDNKAYIKIQDQGCGILTEDLERIFTPYFTTKKEGTGLGLAQARKIMEAHNGSLSVLSTSPKGTIFGLALPIE